MREILGLEPQEIGEQGYRSIQIFEWLYAKRVTDFAQMTNLSKELRETLSQNFAIRYPEVLDAQHSKDGTTKYALRTSGETIEAVHMPSLLRQPGTAALRDGSSRDTLCISSQAGCSFGCKFCVTARMNLRRNLTAAEIIGEVLLLLTRHGRPPRLNIVFMGMGEPLHNYDNTMKAFRILSHSKGVAISPRRITVSTVGFVPAIVRLKNEPVIPNLAVSLNAPDDALRSELIPVNRLYPIRMLMKALADLPLRHRQRITFEYVLLKGVNDSPRQAAQLAEATKEIRCKINLIPLNPDPHLPYERPDDETISRFASVLVDSGRTVAVRRSRGPDISAACGQLGTHYIEPSRIPLALTR